MINFDIFRVGDIALIGLAVMGQNLILNMADHGFTVVAYNRTVEKVQTFLETTAKGKSIVGATSLQDMVDKLKSPRRVMLLVKGIYLIQAEQHTARIAKCYKVTK